MIRLRKSSHVRQFLLLILACITAGQARARPAGENEGSASAAAPAGIEELAGQLGAEVRETAGSTLISRAKKEKRISTAVRVAVVTATTYRNNPADALAQAIALAEVAAQAAPAFTEVVASAASFAPAISRIDGASGKIRTAVFAAAKNKGKSGRATQTARTRERASSPVDPNSYVGKPAVTRARRSVPVPRAPEVNDDTSPSLSAMVATGGSSHPGNNTHFNLNATIGVRHDDNIFLTADKTVGDTSYIITPGLGFRYGLESLAHGSIDYTETFIRYSGKSAPNVSLGAASGSFGYDNGSLTLALNGQFQQLNQNTNATAALGPQIFRRDVLDLGLNLETPLTAKTRLRTGARLNQLKYKTAGLVGTRQTEIPLNLFLETTPKTSVGLGATYRAVKPQGTGPSGHDLYYNLVTRGSFTQKLSGEFSIGYRTREVGLNPRQNLWGFDGALNYAATEKSSLSLQLARDFSTGALGESLTTNRYALRLATAPTLQWSFGAMLSYQTSGFGPTVFNLQNVPGAVDRQDDYWEGSLQASYLFSSWLTASADYSLRKNQSTRPDAHYVDNQFNLTFGLRY